MPLTIVMTSYRVTLLMKNSRRSFGEIMEELKALVTSVLNLQEEPIFLVGHNRFAREVFFDLDIRILRPKAENIEADLGAFAVLNPHVMSLQEKILPEFLQLHLDIPRSQVRVKVAQFGSI